MKNVADSKETWGKWGREREALMLQTGKIEKKKKYRRSREN